MSATANVPALADDEEQPAPQTAPMLPVEPDGAARGRPSQRAGMIAQTALDALIASLGYMAAGPLGAGGAYATRIGARLMESGLRAGRVRGSFEGGAARVPPPSVDLSSLAIGSGRAAGSLYEQ